MAEPKQPKKLAALKGGLNIAKRLFADSDEGAMNAIRSAGRTAHEQEAAIRAAKNAQVKEQMANLPARSKKANESLGLYHPVGGGLKLSKPTSGMHATTVADPKFNPPDIGIITPEQLVKEQAALFPLVGDRAAAGRYLTHVDENELEVPVRLTGGPRYMDANYNPINPDDSAAWESGLGRVTALGRQAERAGQDGRPVYGIYTAGSGTNTDFNIMGANALLQQIPFSKITKKSEREFDRAMKEGTKEFPPIPNWPGIRSPDAQDLILDKSNGIVRTKLFGVMGKENFQSMGFPDVPATRKAIVEPELLDAPTNQAGFRMARMDTSGRIIEDPIIPSDYPTAMAGKVAGKLDVPADYKDIFQSHFDARRLLSQPESGDYYSFSRAHPIQYADDAWLNRLMEKRLADERRIKEGEYKEGGEVDGPSLEDRLTKAIEGHMASGGVVDSMESRLTNAISTHMASGGGAFKKLEFMAGGGKVGKLAQGVASVRNRLMADTLPVTPTVKPPSDNVATVRQSNFRYPKTIGNQTVGIDKLSGGVRMSDPNEAKRVKALADQIASPEGYISRIIVDHNDNVIEGQHRLEALRQLGIKDVPVYKIEEMADTMPVDQMKSAVQGVGAIHPDHVGQIINHALESIASEGVEGARQMDLGRFQKHYDAALDAITSDVKKAEGGGAFKKLQFMDKGGKVGKLASGVANIGKRLLADAPVESPAAKQARLNMMPTARIGVEAPGILIPSKMNNVREAVRNMKGNYGARRVERAADEIPNLEKMYQEDALKEAFTGDNASAMITLSPAEFERYAAELTKRSSVGPKMAELAKQGDIDKMTVPTDEYIQYLQRLQGGFSDVPYLNLFKDEVGLPIKPSVIGHEGRHRSRALSESGAPASLVKINPRGDLREGMPRRTQEDFIEALKEELELSNRLVVPESEPYFRRPDVKFPDVYAEGGGAFKKLSFYDKGGVTTSAGSFSPEELGVTADDLRVMDDKTWERIKKNAPATYDWAKQLVKDEASQLKSARGAKDFALRVGAQTLGGIPDLANLALYGVDTLTGTNLSSENPWFGSQQYLEAMDKAGVLGEHEFPISETVAGFLMPAGLIKKGVKKGVQLYKGKKPEAPKKRRGGLAAMSR
jgi:hypothetical protein